MQLYQISYSSGEAPSVSEDLGMDLGGQSSVGSMVLFQLLSGDNRVNAAWNLGACPPSPCSESPGPRVSRN